MNNFYINIRICLGMEDAVELRALLEKRERVEFAHTVDKYDRRFKVSVTKWY